MNYAHKLSTKWVEYTKPMKETEPEEEIGDDGRKAATHQREAPMTTTAMNKRGLPFPLACLLSSSSASSSSVAHPELLCV